MLKNIILYIYIESNIFKKKGSYNAAALGHPEIANKTTDLAQLPQS